MNRKKRWIRAAQVVLAMVLLAGAIGCAGRKKRKAADEAPLTPREIYDQGMKHLAEHELRKARQILEKIDMTSGDRTLEPLIRLAMADATFFAGDELSLIDAKPLYEDFVVLYGDHPRAPYAKMQAGVCLLEQVNHPSRDQAMTWEAIRELEEVLRRYPDSPYARLAQVKIDNAKAHLAEHEFLIGKFYLKKKVYMAAENRFRNVVRNYPAYPRMDKLYYYLGKAQVYNDNMEEGRIWLGNLIEEWPNSPYLKDARRLMKKDAVADIHKQQAKRKRKEDKIAQSRINERKKQVAKARKRFAKEQAKKKKEGEQEKESGNR